jgi:hypothetical protein
MSDPYFKAIQEQWPNIRGLYMTYGSKKPIILYDIQENKIYAYPYKEFKAEMSKKSQASLEHDYKSASVLGSMVVFVRDNIERKLVSYTMSIDTMTVQWREKASALGRQLIGNFKLAYPTRRSRSRAGLARHGKTIPCAKQHGCNDKCQRSEIPK